MTRRIAALAALLALAPAALRAAPSAQVPIGPRAIGMAGAFSAIADDATASFWNPAGLARVGHQEVMGSHADLFQTGIKDNFAAFVLPISRENAVATDWYHSGFDDPELGFGENRIDFGWGGKLHRMVHAGATLKYLTRNTSLNGATLRSGHGWGTDLGVLVSPLERLRFGLTLQDAFGTSVHYDEGGSELVYPRNVRLGSAYTYRTWGTVAFDVDDRWHLGIEATPIPQVALRAGTEDDRKGYEHGSWTYGVGFKANMFRLDWAREQHPTLDATDHFSLAMEFNFNPALVRIEKVQPRDVYTSLYKTYAKEGLGTLQLRNLEDHSIETTLSVFIPGWMDAPSEQAVILRPHVAQELPITAVLQDRVLSQTGDRPMQIQLAASYQSQRLSRREKATARCVAYGPGAIDWSAGTAQAAAFVTQQDPAVDALARAAGRQVVLQKTDPFGNRNVSFIAAMVNALATLGWAYVPDPSNPFTAVSETQHAVDTIHYPYESIEKRTGDCDDSTVLLAALLENVGVSTRFIDAPGHIFLLASTGVHERNRMALGVDDHFTVVADDEVWIPVETTAIPKGFAEAWRAGAEEWQNWSGRGELALVDVEGAQARYEPTPPPGSRRPTTLDEAALNSRLEKDAAEVSRWREETMKARYGDAAATLGVSAAALDQVAHAYFMAGRHEEAKAKLEEALQHAPQSARAHNNLGVALAATGDAAGAAEQFQTALLEEAGDAGPWLNLGVLLCAAGDTLGARAPAARGVELAGGYEAACALLSLPAADGGEADEAPEARRFTTALRALLRAAPGHAPQAQGAKKNEAGAARPVLDPVVKTRLSGARIDPEARIDRYLYWKP